MASGGAEMRVRETEKRVLPTPFHARAAARCETNLWSSWKGYTVADCYTTLEDEYFAIRQRDLGVRPQPHDQVPRQRRGRPGVPG